MYRTLTKCALCVGVFLVLSQMDKEAYAVPIELENDSIISSTNASGVTLPVQFVSRFSLNGSDDVVSRITYPEGSPNGPPFDITCRNMGGCQRVTVFSFGDYGITNIADAGSLLQIRIMLPTGFNFIDNTSGTATGPVTLFVINPRTMQRSNVGFFVIDNNGTFSLNQFNQFGSLSDLVPPESFSEFLFGFTTLCNEGFTGLPCFGLPSQLTVQPDQPNGLVAGQIAILSNVPSAVPEPATVILLGTGLAAIVARRRKRRAPTD